MAFLALCGTITAPRAAITIVPMGTVKGGGKAKQRLTVCAASEIA